MAKPSTSHPDVLDLWSAYSSPTERLPISSAIGRVATSTIRQYPPGIPDITPGMTYSAAIVSKLTTAFEAGAEIIGLDFTDGGYVEVIKTSRDPSPKVDIETLSATQIDADLAQEIADFFRLGFSTSPYFHYAFHEDDPFKSLPSNMNFEKWRQTLDLETEAEKLAAQNYLLRDALAKLPTFDEIELTSKTPLPRGFHLWTDPALCVQLIQDRLQDQGYVTLVRGPESQNLIGLLHMRAGSIERLFYSEEWHDPFIFSRHKSSKATDSPERFFRKMKFHFDLNPQDEALTISAQLLAPGAQGGEVFYQMMRSMAKRISPSHANLPLLCEIPPSGTAHTLNTAFMDRLIFGVLQNGHPLIYCPKTSNALFPLVADKSHWRSKLKAKVRSERQFSGQHFNSSRTDCLNVEVRPHGHLGLAVFATASIEAGTRVAVFEGETYEAENALALPIEMRDHAIQTGPTSYVFGYRGLAHCLCHSCEPNCGIRGITEIFAARKIEKGEQLTWDYRCSENSTWVLDSCLCGSQRCTGTVKNHDSLSTDMKNEYLSHGMVSDWLTAQTGGKSL